MPDLVRHSALTDEWGVAGELLELLASTGPMAWWRDAACKEHPELTWFPERGADPRPAVRVCSGCLVRPECLAWSMAAPTHLVGIFGGLTAADRRTLRAAQPKPVPPPKPVKVPRPRGRPRKFSDKMLRTTGAEVRTGPLG